MSRTGPGSRDAAAPPGGGASPTGTIGAGSDRHGPRRDAVFLIRTRPRRIEACNARAAEMFRCPAAEIVGRSSEILYAERACFDLVGTEGRAALRDTGAYEREVSLRRADGTVFAAKLTVSLLSPDRGSEAGVVALVQDLDERAAAEPAEASAPHERRLATLGRLAGRVAHDTGNHLSALRTLLELTLPTTIAEADREGIFSTITDIARLMGSVMDVGGATDASAPAASDAADRIRRDRALLESCCGTACRLELELDPSVPVPVPARDLSLILVALVSALRESVERSGARGRVALRLRATRQDDEVRLAARALPAASGSERPRRDGTLTTAAPEDWLRRLGEDVTRHDGRLDVEADATGTTTGVDVVWSVAPSS